MLTCTAPTSGTAKVNGFDIFHESHEVRENRLPAGETPLYTEMKVSEYLDSAGGFGGWMGEPEEADRLCGGACWLGSPRARDRRLVKGYRQRVGLADSLLHTRRADPGRADGGLDPNHDSRDAELIPIWVRFIRCCFRRHPAGSGSRLRSRRRDRQREIGGAGEAEELRYQPAMSARMLVECRGR